MRSARQFLTAALFLHLSLFSIGSAAALTGADVALYNDVGAPDSGKRGAWQNGITAIKRMLTAMGYTYEEITYLDLQYSLQDFSTRWVAVFSNCSHSPVACSRRPSRSSRSTGSM